MERDLDQMLRSLVKVKARPQDFSALKCCLSACRNGVQRCHKIWKGNEIRFIPFKSYGTKWPKGPEILIHIYSPPNWYKYPISTPTHRISRLDIQNHQIWLVPSSGISGAGPAVGSSSEIVVSSGSVAGSALNPWLSLTSA